MTGASRSSSSTRTLIQLPSVVFDAERTGQLATEHLIELGRTRIAIIRERRSGRDSWRRFAGYKKALQAAGIDVDDEFVVGGHPGIAAGVDAAERLLDLNDPPTIVAHNDLMAIGVIHTARRRGLIVPTDLSVVGIDDLEVARYFDPPLTTVPLRKRELGHIEAQKLIKVIAGDSETPVTVLAPSWSCGRRLRRRGPRVPHHGRSRLGCRLTSRRPGTKVDLPGGGVGARPAICLPGVRRCRATARA